MLKALSLRASIAPSIRRKLAKAGRGAIGGEGAESSRHRGADGPLAGEGEGIVQTANVALQSPVNDKMGI